MLTNKELEELDVLEFRAYTDLPFGPAEQTRMHYLQAKLHYGDPAQSQMDSFIEASINIMIGFLLSWSLWWPMNWLFNLHASFGQSFLITMIYTFFSFARQYFIRRCLNGKIIWRRLYG